MSCIIFKYSMLVFIHIQLLNGLFSWDKVELNVNQLIRLPFNINNELISIRNKLHLDNEYDKKVN